MPSRQKLAPLAALAVAVVIVGLLVVLGGGGTKGESSSAFLLNKPAPTVRGDTFDGASFDLARRKGSWVVLNFFQSSCVPCKAEHPELVGFVEQQRSLGPAGAEFYTIVYDDDEQNVRDFFAEFGGEWPIIKDPNGEISVSFGVTKVPETWIVDPNGIIVRRYAGQVTSDGLARDLQQLRDASGL